MFVRFTYPHSHALPAKEAEWWREPGNKTKVYLDVSELMSTILLGQKTPLKLSASAHPTVMFAIHGVVAIIIPVVAILAPIYLRSKHFLLLVSPFVTDPLYATNTLIQIKGI